MKSEFQFGRSPISRVRRRTSLDGFGAVHAAIAQAT
jgi:hypothetical protein